MLLQFIWEHDAKAVDLRCWVLGLSRVCLREVARKRCPLAILVFRGMKSYEVRVAWILGCAGSLC